MKNRFLFVLLTISYIIFISPYLIFVLITAIPIYIITGSGIDKRMTNYIELFKDYRYKLIGDD